ncbi:MAG: branched-chain amino acid ABC transporter permease [Spirochaetales bacterium]|nr:branched-chain amino acid ABC transporter permease [Spirochaetales bacterium]
MVLQQLVNGLTQGSLFALLAISFSIVYGTLRLVNFATGSIYMIGAFAGWLVVRYVTAHLFLALLAGAGAGFVTGFVLERFAFRALRGVARIASLICTIGFSWFLNELMSVLFGAERKSMPPFYSETAFAVAGVNVSWLQIILITVVAAILIALQIFIFKTKIGLAIRAVSLDFKTAGLMGIPIDRVISLTFSIAGAMAGIAGVLASAYYNAVFPFMGNIAGLKSFSAAVFGGLTSIPGAILGGYLLGLVENFGVQIISAGYRDIIGFAIMVLVLLVRPRGLLGRKSA